MNTKYPCQKIPMIIILGIFLLPCLGQNGSDPISVLDSNQVSSSIDELTKKAEQGNRLIQYMLGSWYHAGQIVPQDYTKAIRWYRAAAEQGHETAQFGLGFIYGGGEGVPQDYQEAIKWYRAAAEQGHGYAQNNLGDMYRNGEGVSKDYVQAYMWLSLAMARITDSYKEMASSNLEMVIEQMTPEQISQAEMLVREWKPTNPFVPVTDAVLNEPDPSDWLRWRRGHGASGYSPLVQIDRQNVHKLKLAWSLDMDKGPQEQEPIIYRGVMYLPHPQNVVQALDAKTGTLIWEYRRELPKNANTGATRNIAIYQNKIFLASQDAYLIALDAESGNVVWEVKVADHTRGVRYSAGPIAADGKVFAGQTCGVGTSVACFVSAHDVNTGELIWKREAVAGPKDPEEHNATWEGLSYEKRKKASFWLTGSYDPDLKLLYWTTSSSYPYPEILKGTGKGALLYTNSILALHADTGDIEWFFQMQPRDNFDMDHQDNPILADVEIDGIHRKVVYTLGKTGILWALDRETGAHLWNRQLVAYQNIFKNINPETGAIVMNEDIIPRETGTTQLVCPGMRGGKLFQADSYSPETGLLYSPVSNECGLFKILPLDVSVSGVNYAQLQHMKGAEGKVGRLSAVSAATGVLQWTYDQRVALGSVLTTGGGLVFVGDLDRYFRAFDALSGEVLWEIPLSAPVTGYPISYAVDRKQYIAVGVGEYTSGQRHLAQLYPEVKSPTGSNILMVFELGE